MDLKMTLKIASLLVFFSLEQFKNKVKLSIHIKIFYCKDIEVSIYESSKYCIVIALFFVRDRYLW